MKLQTSPFAVFVSAVPCASLRTRDQPLYLKNAPAQKMKEVSSTRWDLPITSALNHRPIFKAPEISAETSTPFRRAWNSTCDISVLTCAAVVSFGAFRQLFSFSNRDHTPVRRSSTFARQGPVVRVKLVLLH